MKGFFITSLIVLLFGGFVFAQANRPVSKEAETKTFVISKGQGAREIAEGLERGKLIRSRNYFLLTVWMRGDQGAFKAGSYELSPSMTAREIERLLAGGAPLSNERSVTIVEGWTIDDIADYLEREGVASKDEFFAETGESAKYAVPGQLPDWAASFPALKDRPVRATLEGYLFPDTYRIYVDGGAKALVRRMLANFEIKLTPEFRAEISRRGKSIFEIVTMASVIEAEVRSDEDRAMISDIFWKRVKAGRGLEADSTVNYITGHSKPSVSTAETKLDNPWNTYKYRGLPAGPIGNPGSASLRAAIYPKANPYWYFLTDKDGNVHYGKTLEEHNANKAKYLE